MNKIYLVVTIALSAAVNGFSDGEPMKTFDTQTDIASAKDSFYAKAILTYSERIDLLQGIVGVESNDQALQNAFDRLAISIIIAGETAEGSSELESAFVKILDKHATLNISGLALFSHEKNSLSQDFITGREITIKSRKLFELIRIAKNLIEKKGAYVFKSKIPYGTL